MFNIDYCPERTRFYKSKQIFFHTAASWIAVKNAPWIEDLNNFIGWALAMGKMIRQDVNWSNNEVSILNFFKGFYERNIAKANGYYFNYEDCHHESSTEKQLTIKHLTFPLGLLMIGMICASVVFVIEIILNSWNVFSKRSSKES